MTFRRVAVCPQRLWNKKVNSTHIHVISLSANISTDIHSIGYCKSRKLPRGLLVFRKVYIHQTQHFLILHVWCMMALK